jgi:hypothetical protein
MAVINAKRLLANATAACRLARSYTGMPPAASRQRAGAIERKRLPMANGGGPGLLSSPAGGAAARAGIQSEARQRPKDPKPGRQVVQRVSGSRP